MTAGSARAISLLIAGGIALLACERRGAPVADLEARWEEARRIYREEGAEPALPLLERLLADYRTADDAAGEAKALAQIGNCHKQLGDYEGALDLLGKARGINRETGDWPEEGWTVNSIGLVYWEMADYEQAIAHFGEALRIGGESGDRQLEATVFNNSALVQDELGHYDRSLDLYDKALAAFRDLGDRHRENYVLGNLGGVRLLVGDFRQAADYYRQALEISRELGAKPAQAIDQGNLGLCLLGMGRIDEALEQLDSALELSRQTGQKKEQADWRHGRASLYLRTGRYPEALAEYDTALRIYADSGLRRQQVEALAKLGELRLLLGDPVAAELEFRRGKELAESIGFRRGEILHLLSLGDLRQRRQELDEAVSLYEQAHQVAEDTGDRLDTALSLLRRAAASRRRGDPEAALALAHRAREQIAGVSAVFAEAEADLEEATALEDLGRFAEENELLAGLARRSTALEDPEVAWRAHHRLGHAMEGLGRPDEALDAYGRAVEVLQSVRYRLRDAGILNAYLEERYEPYMDVARLAIRAGSQDRAFQASLQLRLRAFEDLLERDPGAADFLETRPEAREKIRRLRQTIEARKSLPAEEQQVATLGHLVEELRRAQAAYGRSVAGGESLSWRDRLSVGEAPQLLQIQSCLPADAAVVEFLVDRDALYVFVLRAQSLRALAVPVAEKDLVVRVELLRDLLLQEGSSDWKGPAVKLRELLIQPLEQEGWLRGTNRLYIVPHRALHYLPFAALIRPGGGRLLVEEYEVAYLPSAALLEPGRAAAAPKSLLALAPERAALRFHEEEVVGLAAAFRPPFEVLTGATAAESLFKRKAGEFGVLHLATHSEFNRWNPLLSRLALQPDATDDGDLEVREILELELRADLVALSACRTGFAGGRYSDLPPGDEFLGLTQAFVLAGAKTVLASLWDVDDRSTLELMRSFYAGRGVAEPPAALAAAQRSMLRAGGRYAHPRFWAGFAVFGGFG